MLETAAVELLRTNRWCEALGGVCGWEGVLGVRVWPQGEVEEDPDPPEPLLVLWPLIMEFSLEESSSLAVSALSRPALEARKPQAERNMASCSHQPYSLTPMTGNCF